MVPAKLARFRHPAVRPGAGGTAAGPGLDLVDLQARRIVLNRAQNLAHRLIDCVDDADPQRGRGSRRPVCCGRCPVEVGEDLAGFDQKGPPGWSELHVVGGALEQKQAPVTLQPPPQQGRKAV
jgi:hypothetical protein